MTSDALFSRRSSRGTELKTTLFPSQSKFALSFLSPNIIFQKEQTDKEVSIAMDEVPRTVGIVQENERIIGRHERVTDEVKLKLDSLRKAKAERGADINRLTTFVGKFSISFR